MVSLLFTGLYPRRTKLLQLGVGTLVWCRRVAAPAEGLVWAKHLCLVSLQRHRRNSRSALSPRFSHPWLSASRLGGRWAQLTTTTTTSPRLAPSPSPGSDPAAAPDRRPTPEPWRQSAADRFQHPPRSRVGEGRPFFVKHPWISICAGRPISIRSSGFFEVEQDCQAQSVTGYHTPYSGAGPSWSTQDSRYTSGRVSSELREWRISESAHPTTPPHHSCDEARSHEPAHHAHITTDRLLDEDARHDTNS